MLIVLAIEDEGSTDPLSSQAVCRLKGPCAHTSTYIDTIYYKPSLQDIVDTGPYR